MYRNRLSWIVVTYERACCWQNPWRKSHAYTAVVEADDLTIKYWGGIFCRDGSEGFSSRKRNRRCLPLKMAVNIVESIGKWKGHLVEGGGYLSPFCCTHKYLTLKPASSGNRRPWKEPFAIWGQRPPLSISKHSDASEADPRKSLTDKHLSPGWHWGFIKHSPL